MKKVFTTLFITLFLVPITLFAQVAKNGNNVSLSSPGNGVLDIFSSGTGNINFGTNGTRRFSLDSSGVLDLLSAGKFTTLTFDAAATIRATTSDTADNLSLSLCGGGSCATDGSRGATLFLPGEQNASVDTLLIGGVATGSDIFIIPRASDGSIELYPGGSQKWTLASTGAITQNGSNGGNISLTRAGTAVNQPTLNTVTAAGNSSCSAPTALTSVFNNVTVVAAAAEGVQLWDQPVGSMVCVKNSDAADALTVCRQGSDTIDGATSKSVAIGAVACFMEIAAGVLISFEAPAA